MVVTSPVPETCPDVEPCPPRRRPTEGRGTGTHAEGDTRPVCLLERSTAGAGHVWQGRYYSCPLDEAHLWEALRYTELNPVRASLVAKARCSGLVQCNRSLWRALDRSMAGDALVAWSMDPFNWHGYLDAGLTESQLAAIRRSTYSGRPLGSQEFIRMLEKETKRRLAPQKRGPRRRSIRARLRRHFLLALS